LCQEALAKAWQARASYQQGTNLKAWLFMILRNQFYTEKRKSWRQRPWEDEHEQSLTTKPSQESSMTLSQVALRMRELPPEQREALILVSAGGFSYEDAARICNCPIGTIKSRVARARTALEKAMAAPSQGPNKSQERIDGMQEIEGALDHLSHREPPASPTAEAL
jgi:RNA polymerase sigma-70 factor (ECF subfamily)